MTAPVRQPSPSPDLFFETMTAYQRTEALKAAIELDLFTAIGEGVVTPPVLAGRCLASERGMRILCDYLVVIGFLEKRDGGYRLTPDSATFLDRRSPACIAAAVSFLGSPLLTERFQDLAAAVRKGGTVAPDSGAIAPEHPMWLEFARGMAPLMAVAAEAIAKLLGAPDMRPGKVLDIAASHGLFGITLAKQDPNLEVVAVDWPNVLELSRANARAAGVSARYRALAGSAFEVEFGTGYQAALLTNFLHHFDPATCEKLLRKIGAALADGGRVAALEFVPNEDRVSPPRAAAFGLTMLAGTPAGDAYTFAELERMFRNAGFRSSELHPLESGFQSIVISQK